MSCYVCAQPPNTRLGFYCATCARNKLYALRFEYTNVLLEKDSVGIQIEQSIAKNAKENSDILNGEIGLSHKTGVVRSELEPSRLSIQTKRTGISQSAARTQEILSHVTILKREIEERKEQIAQRRAALAPRRSDAESANYELTSRRTAALGIVQNNIKTSEKLWDNLHSKTVESRAFLCREIANLFGLRQRTRRRNGELTNSFSIGGISIVDLRDMNNVSSAQITTSLTHISRLLILVSHYLALRLPAEIVPPQRGHPLPTVFAPSVSYMPRDNSSSNKSPSSPGNSATPRGSGIKLMPHSRPLFIDRTLPKLAKEDPAGYALFIEGVSLLAWDISWLCRTQGLHVGLESWEEVCQIGRNLWQLLVAPPAYLKALTGRDNQPIIHSSSNKEVSKGNINNTPHTNNVQRPRSLPTFGHYSHGSAHSFLGSAEGMEFMKTWKLPSPVKIADKLKSTLLGEMANAEWELLEEEEWEEEENGQQQQQQGRDENPRADTTNAK